LYDPDPDLCACHSATVLQIAGFFYSKSKKKTKDDNNNAVVEETCQQVLKNNKTKRYSEAFVDGLPGTYTQS